MINNLKAFLFDLNGTMIDDMEYHLDVWFDVITNDLGGTLTKAEVRAQMYGKNDEVLTRIFGEARFKEFDFEAISKAKEERYQQIYRPHLDLIHGLFDFLETAKEKKIKMAIGSAAPPINIDFVLDNLNLRDYFPVVVSGGDVTESKPHPEVFLKAAHLLGVAPEYCIVFEDAPKGVEAAANAGMKCVVVTTMHTIEEFQSYSNVLMFINDYTDHRLLTLGT
ncbi:HAD family phosphatase [Chryseolinea sp. H1M3-3]|uniref:HAD family hydrolase n=1 Tax=Chryseolinea sp. H1M3-3 TaxID=3034144 RepID=UPI0023EB3BC8|nr:HAD family phosphatase [Chryseolinea sp. H1M3-3]